MMSSPVELMGSLLEYVLNFHYANGGFFGLVRNIMHVKVVIPHWNSANFLSLIGLLDARKELDSEIKHGDPMYYPALSIMACKTVYSNAAYNQAVIEGPWKMEFLGFKNYWNDFTGKPDTQVVMFRDKGVDHDTIVVCFRGTEPFNLNDWCSDVDLSWHEIRDIGRIHSGFMKALGMQSDVGWPDEVDNDSYSGGRKAALAYYDIRDTLRTLLRKNPDTKFIVTGHSLGGALAALFPAICFYHDERLLLDRMEAIYTFGQPRVGDEAFGNYMNINLKRRGIQYYRYVYCNDVVPRVPPNLVFKHFGTCVYYDSRYQSSIVKEVPYENYFSIWGGIAMLKNAIFELLRGFVMGRRYGEDYKESWLLFGMRMIGLLIPGLPAHCPQDYVNSTRLGTVHLIHRIFHH
ncbi:Alpha/beta-Hydrolases superfamily protein, putative isoform 2 [Hibiscus syriacus]|uniref:Alpha/beta-Hydrolases superfamily protein, putative isoform 2 n=2 Tax=Hibiscus syriacus TaxID=106335 RepID=A0A6A2WVR2_HIBSY|nr:Alpha/beta-Hydrolases superfamily protein, putative isoform 2 [Hibiscus syriacus]